MKIAVVVPTYNRPDMLAAVLDGYLIQDDVNFEVIVADDGSKPDTAALVKDYQQRATFPLLHVWQEDIGFRLSAIRNRAVAATDAEYFIFTDGDCVPLAGFVASHRRLAEPGCFLSGSRILLSEAFTEQILQQRLPIHLWSRQKWLSVRLAGGIKRVLPLLPLPDWTGWRKRERQRWQGAKTCNLSLWRSDLVLVNGMDESYVGWGMDDSDLVIRLLRAGVRRKSARCSEPVFHLWHRENDRSQLPENQARLQQVLQATHIRAVLGLDQYL